MLLTSELFKKIVSPEVAQPEQAAQSDRRRSPRTQFEFDATLMPFSERFASENLEVPVRDISRGGFRFLHDRPLPLGEQFALLLPESTGRPLVICCVVAYWQPVGENLFAIGARFCRVLRERQADLNLLLQDADSGEPAEQRAAS
jgi:hypothetical protein